MGGMLVRDLKHQQLSTVLEKNKYWVSFVTLPWIHTKLVSAKHFYLFIGGQAQTFSACHPTWSDVDQTRQPGPAIPEDLLDVNIAPPVHLQLDSEPPC